VEGKNPVYVDVRDVFAFEKSHIEGAIHLPLELLSQKLNTLPTDRSIIVYCEMGKKAHQALRTLVGAGFKDVTNVSGGHTSLQRHARAIGFKNIKLELLPVASKSLTEEMEKEEQKTESKKVENSGTLIVDVRTVQEFNTGAYPGALNIPLDDVMQRRNEFGNDLGREIVVYCASGGRSAYAQRQLMQLGYTNVKNGGGISAMMASRNDQSSATASTPSTQPLIVDVRSPQEFSGGAYPGAVNIPLDELQMHINKLGSPSRDITLYCASGARSAYGQRILQQHGFTNVKNGGGIMQMMSRR